MRNRHSVCVYVCSCVCVCVCVREREGEKERWTGYPSTTVYHLVLLCLLIPLFRMGPSVYTMNGQPKFRGVCRHPGKEGLVFLQSCVIII